MYVLDTNIISELMRAKPAPSLMRWLNACPESALFTTTINEAEIRFGLASLPDGRRRDHLVAAAADAMFDQDFNGRILPFDRSAAASYAEIRTARRGLGLGEPEADMQIAAIATSRGAQVATNNASHFAGADIRVVNPWTIPNS